MKTQILVVLMLFAGISASAQSYIRADEITSEDHPAEMILRSDGAGQTIWDNSDFLLSGIRDTITLHADTIRDHELRLEQLELIDHPAVSLTTDDSQIVSLTGQDLTFNSSILAKLDELNVYPSSGSSHYTGGVGNRNVYVSNSNIEFRGSSSGGAIMRLRSTTEDGLTILGDIAGAYTLASGLNYFYYGGTYTSPAMVIKPNFNIGIGTLYPSNKLDVNGEINTSSSFRISGTDLLLNSLKSGSIGPAGTFLKSVGSTVTPDWASLSTNDLSDNSILTTINNSGAGSTSLVDDNSTNDLDAITRTGFYRTTDNSNGQVASTGGSLIHITRVGGANMWQLYSQYTGNDMWFRRFRSSEGGWQSWYRFWHSGNSNLSTVNWDADILTANSLQFVDAATSINKDASNNLTFTDAVTGTKTLANIAFLDATTNNFTGEINATKYSLNGTDINTSGTLSNITYKDDTASVSTLGIVKVDGNTIAINDGTISVNGGAASWNYSTQQLSGTSVVWNVVNGLNAKISLTAATTITFSNLQDGQSGTLRVINGGSELFRITFSGYPLEIHPAIRHSQGVVYVSGTTGSVDSFSWKYIDGVIQINGGFALN